MVTKKELTCIGCPMGCLASVELCEGKIVRIEGCLCTKGKAYAETECINPMRTFTSSVPVDNGRFATVPVKTAGKIPKDKMFDCVRELQTFRVKAPVASGKVILKNIAGTGVNIIATSTIALSEPNSRKRS